MRLPVHVANPGLAALIAGSGFPSLERFAVAVNHRGWEMHGIKTSHDHVTVKRWLAGSVCQYPDVVAAVLSDAWGVEVPEAVIWPELRDGRPSAPAYLQPWAAARTLEELALFVRSDMLTRRESLTGAVKAVSGPALLAPIARWLGVPPGRLPGNDDGMRRLGLSDVEAIERSTRYFAATDAEVGGAFSREAAVGQLKYAVDLARHASYGERTGNQLLVAIAELSGLVGWLCHDSGMIGPAQRYFMYGLQAARESTAERAPLLVVSILADMAQQMRWLGRPSAALRLHDLAIGQLPDDRRRFNVLRAVLSAKRAENGLCYLGPSCLTEVQSALNLAFDLHARASQEDKATAGGLWHRVVDMSEAELSMSAAASYLTMARDDPKLAVEAERHTMGQLANISENQGRNKVFGRIRLARIRFLAGELEQACDDGNQALDEAERVITSAMIRIRLRELVADAEPYAELPGVRELRARVGAALQRSG
jgi:hypothetical protein